MKGQVPKPVFWRDNKDVAFSGLKYHSTYNEPAVMVHIAAMLKGGKKVTMGSTSKTKLLNFKEALLQYTKTGKCAVGATKESLSEPKGPWQAAFFMRWRLCSFMRIQIFR